MDLFCVAMDVDNAENAASTSAIISSSFSQQNEVLSAEDLAWADSCIIKDSDVPVGDWIPLRDALLEIISSQSQSFSNDIGEDVEILPDIEESNTKTIRLEPNQESSTSDEEHLSRPSSSHNVNPIRMVAETSTDEIPDIESYHRSPFLPTYNEELNQNENIDSGLVLDSSAFEMENTSENLFKIWDWDIPSEEGELAEQLDKALTENTFQAGPSSVDDSGKLGDLKEGSLDDLIAGIADLSLNKKV